MKTSLFRPLLLLVAITTGPTAAALGEIVVNEDRIRVVQEAAPCVFDVQPGNLTISPAGGAIITTVAVIDRCAWSASSQEPWITIASGTSGTGSGSATFKVAPNTGPLRAGNITVAGQTFSVTQDASGSARLAVAAADPAGWQRKRQRQGLA